MARTDFRTKMLICERLTKLLCKTDEVTSNGAHLWKYEEGHSDTTVGKELNVSRHTVGYVRQKAFGNLIRPPHDPLSVKHSSPNAYVRNTLRDHDARLATIERRIEFLARELGVTWPKPVSIPVREDVS